MIHKAPMRVGAFLLDFCLIFCDLHVIINKSILEVFMYYCVEIIPALKNMFGRPNILCGFFNSYSLPTTMDYYYFRLYNTETNSTELISGVELVSNKRKYGFNKKYLPVRTPFLIELEKFLGKPIVMLTFKKEVTDFDDFTPVTYCSRLCYDLDYNYETCDPIHCLWYRYKSNKVKYIHFDSKHNKAYVTVRNLCYIYSCDISKLVTLLTKGLYMNENILRNGTC